MRPLEPSETVRRPAPACGFPDCTSPAVSMGHVGQLTPNPESTLYFARELSLVPTFLAPWCDFGIKVGVGGEHAVQNTPGFTFASLRRRRWGGFDLHFSSALCFRVPLEMRAIISSFVPQSWLASYSGVSDRVFSPRLYQHSVVPISSCNNWAALILRSRSSNG
jgi:hypothetical protein